MNPKAGLLHACVPKWVDDGMIGSDGATTDIRTWERRYVNQHFKQVVRLLDYAQVLAYLLDPVYAQEEGGMFKPPSVPEEHYDREKKMIFLYLSS